MGLRRNDGFGTSFYVFISKRNDIRRVAEMGTFLLLDNVAESMPFLVITEKGLGPTEFLLLHYHPRQRFGRRPKQHLRTFRCDTRNAMQVETIYKLVIRVHLPIELRNKI